MFVRLFSLIKRICSFLAAAQILILPLQPLAMPSRSASIESEIDPHVFTTRVVLFPFPYSRQAPSVFCRVSKATGENLGNLHISVATNWLQHHRRQANASAGGGGCGWRVLTRRDVKALEKRGGGVFSQQRSIVILAGSFR